MNNDVVLKISFTLQFAMAYAFIVQLFGGFLLSQHSELSNIHQKSANGYAYIRMDCNL
jgi:hypothetical protein